MSSVTIEDVAKLAHVSTATVSRILNQRGYVSKETAKKVQEAVETLNYAPKFSARQLASNENKTSIIGAVFASRKTNFYQDELFYTLIQGIGDIVDDYKYNLLVSHVDGSLSDPFESLPSLITNHMVDGLIVGGIPLDSQFIRKIIKLGVPVVVIGNYNELKVPKIIVDNFDGGFKATEHLIKLGHRKIGIISGDQTIYPFRDKLAG
ncbi:MAG: LacI family DNA-binding transcriptional regulator, partial [Sphaerochaetaceae bacterium]